MSLMQNVLHHVEELETENAILREAIMDCLQENGHLADGENCTLIGLKRALKNIRGGV